MITYRSFGFFGLAVLAFGLLAGLISGEWSSLYVVVHLLFGGALLGLYLFTHVENLKDSLSGRRAKYGTNTVVYTVLTLTVIGLINFMGVRHERRYDATEQGQFSLAPQTRQLLEDLDRDVRALAFVQAGQERRARDLLDSYVYVSDRFSYEIVDPDQRPEMADQHAVTQYGTIVLTAGEDSTRVTETTEEAVTNGLIRISQARKKRVYYVTGHGEPDLEASDTPEGYGQVISAMENEGYEVDELLLGSVPDVPGDADAVLVAAPQRPYLEHELEVLRRYIQRGGPTLIMLEPRQGEDLAALVEELGIEVGDDVVVDQFVQLFAGAQLGVEPIVSDYGVHPITEGFGQRTIYSLARTVETPDELPAGVSATELARTSPSSWAESDVLRLFEASEAGFDEADRQGPVSVATAATLRGEALSWTPPAIEALPDAPDLAGDGAEDENAEATTPDDPGDGDGGDGELGNEDADATGDQDQAGARADDVPPADLEGRVVVVGDTDWISNQFVGVYFNQDLFLNALGWLAGEEELISIRPRGTRASRVVLTQAENRHIFYLTVLLLPELILFAGLAIWWRRRR